MHQLNVAVSGVTVNRQLQGINAASAGRNQRHHRAAQTGRERIDINTQVLLFRNVEHVERDDAGNAQLKQLQRQVEVTLQVGGVHDVNQ
ncbi:Uncharacterised protein [Enterobacter cancerogenus]|uniref:Uncharacterized protein n=1 Tax=Enterobacter cancerogenus TaxID=69218 RepID=A0A484YA15_9ENTR|nr:Uncharacterised protein [Enterobacter cancerogenus]